MSLLGAKVRFLWPDDGTTADSLGEIVHVSWGDDGVPGLDVRWQPPAHPRLTFVRDPSWLVTEDGQPLVIPPRTVTVQTGDLL